MYVETVETVDPGRRQLRPSSSSRWQKTSELCCQILIKKHRRKEKTDVRNDPWLALCQTCKNVSAKTTFFFSFTNAVISWVQLFSSDQSG